jgi:hypothetical protein
MAQKSILSLSNTLCDLGYYPEHIKSYINTIDQILQRGIATTNRTPVSNRPIPILKRAIDRILKRGIASNDKRPRMICATGIRPSFKINPKSIDVFLRTKGELNVLRIFHPSNPFCKGESEAGCYAGNQKWLALNFNDKDRGPDKGFYFT